MTQITDETKIKIETRAQALINSMSKHEYRNAGAHFDTNMTGLLPSDKLEELWTTMQFTLGAFVAQLKGAVAIDNALGPVVVILCKFEKADADLFVTFDAASNIAGFHYTPAVKPPVEAAAHAPS